MNAAPPTASRATRSAGISWSAPRRRGAGRRSRRLGGDGRDRRARSSPPGTLVVESDVKKVQHPTGGVVGEIHVRDGDRVKAGDVLIRLDETQTRANLAIIEKSLDELAARQARLEAERDGAGRRSRFRRNRWPARDDAERRRAHRRRAAVFRYPSAPAREGQQVAIAASRSPSFSEEIGGIEAQEQAKATRNRVDREGARRCARSLESEPRASSRA